MFRAIISRSINKESAAGHLEAYTNALLVSIVNSDLTNMRIV
jgi:hypothetical protein